MEGLRAWPTLESSTSPQGMNLMYSDDLKDPGNAIFLVEPSLVPSISDIWNLETTLDEALLTPEEVSREFETQSAEIEPTFGLSGMTQETVLFITTTALPTFPLNLETVDKGLSSIVPGSFPSTPPASGFPQQVNEPETLTESSALPKIRSSLYCSEVDSSLKIVPADGITLEISENQITETSSLDKDSRPRMIRSEGLQESTEREANRHLSLTCNQSHPSPHSTAEPPKLPERVEMVDLTGSVLGVFTSANNFSQSTKACPARACSGLLSPFQALSYTAMLNTRPVDDDTPLGERNLSRVEGRSGLPV